MNKMRMNDFNGFDEVSFNCTKRTLTATEIKKNACKRFSNKLFSLEIHVCKLLQVLQFIWGSSEFFDGELSYLKRRSSYGHVRHFVSSF